MSMTRQPKTANGYGSSLPLFDARPEPAVPVPVTDPNVLDSDRPRLCAACLRVLARLRQGPATNLELGTPECGGQRFGGRLRDLRVAGVLWKKEHVEGAVWRYELIRCPENLS